MTMGYREVSRDEVKELLRSWLVRRSAREVARDTGFDRKTVARYVTAAGELGLWEKHEIEDDDVDAIVSRMRLQVRPKPSPAQAQLVCYGDRISAWLYGEPRLRLRTVHSLLRQQGVGVTYATLRRFAINTLGWTNGGALDPKSCCRSAPGKGSLVSLLHDPGCVSGAAWGTHCPSDGRFCLSGIISGVEYARYVIEAALRERALELGVEPPPDIEGWVRTE